MVKVSDKFYRMQVRTEDNFLIESVFIFEQPFFCVLFSQVTQFKLAYKSILIEFN